jgi:regulator of sigma E protease
MSIVQTILAFLLALTVLIFVHEFGHYWVARKFNVKIIKFSIGFGPSLFSRKFGPDQTEWSFSAIPLGGFVRMVDEREKDAVIAPEDLPRAFTRQSLAKRSAIVVAGPLANFILAIALYAVLSFVGISEPVAMLDDGSTNSAAAKAGITRGDKVVSVDGDAVRSWNDFRLRMLDGAIERRNIDLEVIRAGQSSPQVLKIDASGLASGEIEKDFLKTLGLELQMGEIIVNQVMAAGRAEQAGLKVGDVVLALNGEAVIKATALIAKIRTSAEQAIELKIRREGVEQLLMVTPLGTLENQAAIDGVESTAKRVGKIGAALQNKVETAVISFGPLDSVIEGAKKTWDMSIFSLRMMGKMVIGELSLKNLSGPISIADYAGQSARVGWYAYVGFLALISISLGVLNLMPIPVLDGGHLVYYALEAIKGKPLSERFMSLTQKAGVGVVLLMMFVAVFNDLNRLISG